MPTGLYLTHKPAGATSFSVVQALAAAMRASGRRPRVCHGGTLDPFATGLLIVLAAPATRLMELLHAVPKHYEAQVAWGAETDNGDPTGAVVARGDAGALATGHLDDALAAVVGWRDQVPPATSAKRVDGERAYVRVHRGEAVTLPPCRVYLHEAHWVGHDLPGSSRLALVCRGGYYVRALARDLGRALGCRAHLAALHRSRIGPWDDPGAGQPVPVAGPAAMPWCTKREVDDGELGTLRSGGVIERGQVGPPDWALPPGFPDPEAPIRAVHQGRLVAMLEQRGEGLATRIELGRGIGG